MLGTTLQISNALPVPLLRQVPLLALFGCLFLVSFLGCFLGAQRGPKGSPKWSKIDQKGVQKRYSEKGTKKAPKTVFFRPPECGSSVVNRSKIDDFDVLVLGPFWVSFLRCFGSPGGGQEHQKEVLKSLSKL